MSSVRPCVRMRGWLRLVVLIGGALFLFSIIYGPYLDYSIQQSTNGTLNNTTKTVNFIRQVQNSPEAKVSRDASAWEVRSIEALCAKTRAACPPLPADVARSLQAD
jgi:hypothetical protein